MDSFVCFPFHLLSPDLGSKPVLTSISRGEDCGALFCTCKQTAGTEWKVDRIFFGILCYFDLTNLLICPIDIAIYNKHLFAEDSVAQGIPVFMTLFSFL